MCVQDLQQEIPEELVLCKIRGWRSTWHYTEVRAGIDFPRTVSK